MAHKHWRALQIAFRSPHLLAPTAFAFPHERPFLAYFFRSHRRYCLVEDDQRCGDTGEVAVFWDLNVSNVPDNIDPHFISPNIIHSLRKSGFSGPVSIHAYGNTRALNDQEFLHALVSTGVDLHHVPGGVKDLNSRLLVDLLLWVKENLPPANLLLISRDKSFSSVMHKLQMRGYDVFWAYPDEEISSDLLGLASKVWAWESVIRGVAVERPYISLAQVGDSPLQRFSMQHAELDIKTDLCNSDAQQKQHGIPKEVVDKLLDIIRLRPNGFTLPALRRQLIKSNIVLDKDFYGHKDLLAFLLSIPELKASLVWTTDRTRTYIFTETGGANFGIKGDCELRLHEEKKSTTGPYGKHVLELNASQRQECLLKNQLTNEREGHASQQKEPMLKNLAENSTAKVTMSSTRKSMYNWGRNLLRRVTKLLSFAKANQNENGIPCIKQGCMEYSAVNKNVGDSETVTDSIKSKSNCRNNLKSCYAENTRSIDSIMSPREVCQNKGRQVIEIVDWRDEVQNDNFDENQPCFTENTVHVEVGKVEALETNAALKMENENKSCQSKRRQVIEVLGSRHEVHNDSSVENQQCSAKNAFDLEVCKNGTPEINTTFNIENSHKNLSFHATTDDVQSDEFFENIQSIPRKVKQGKSDIVEENVTANMGSNKASSNHVLKLEAHRNSSAATQNESHQSASSKRSKVLSDTKLALSMVRRELPSKEELESMGCTDQLWKESVLYLASKEGRQKLAEENAMNNLTKILMQSKVPLIEKYKEKQLYKLASIISSYLLLRDVETCKDTPSENRNLNCKEEESKKRNSDKYTSNSSSRMLSIESLVESIVIKDLKEMLLGHFQGCKGNFALCQVKPEFKKKYGYELDYKVLGHSSLLSLVKSFNWVVMSDDKHHTFTLSVPENKSNKQK